MDILIDKKRGRGALDLAPAIGRLGISQLRGSVRVTGIGSPISGGGLDASYQALLTYATGQGYAIPSPEVQALQNTLVVQMKADGTWDAFDVLYVTIGDGDSNFARLNWKAPAAHPIPAGGVYEKFKGIDSNGSSISIAPSFSQFQLTDASMVGDYQVAPAGDFFYLFGYGSGGRTSVRIPRQAPPRLDVEFCDSVASQFTILPTSQTQVFAHTQRVNNTKSIWEFGVLAGSVTQAPSSLPSGSCIVVPAQTGATLRFFGLGSSMAGDELLLYQSWSNYLAGINPLRAAFLYQNITAFATLQGYTLPSSSMQAAGQALILALVVADIWDQLDAFFVFKTNGDANFAKINWKTLTLGAMATGGGSFTSMDGLDTSTSITYNYTPSAAGNKWSLTNASFFVDNKDKREAGSATGGYLIGNNLASERVHSYWFDSAPYLYVQFAINDATAKNGIIGTDYTTAVEWLTHVQRFSSSSSSVIRDGVTRSANMAAASTAVPTVSLISGADANQRQRFMGAGSSLDGREAALATALTNYKSAA